MAYTLTLIICLALLASTSSTEDCNDSDIPDCKIINGEASCITYNLTKVFDDLPKCVESIRIVVTLKDKTFLTKTFAFQKTDISKFPSLRSLQIQSMRIPLVYSYAYLRLSDETWRRKENLANIEILQLNLKSDDNIHPLLQSLPNIKVLDLTTTTKLGLDHIAKGLDMILKQKSPLVKLILKAVQTASLGYNASVNLDHFTCNHNRLDTLDLSYNDITTITGGKCINVLNTLRTLKLNNNLIVAYGSNVVGYLLWIESFDLSDNIQSGKDTKLWDNVIRIKEVQHPHTKSIFHLIKAFSSACNIHLIPFNTIGTTLREVIENVFPWRPRGKDFIFKNCSCRDFSSNFILFPPYLKYLHASNFGLKYPFMLDKSLLKFCVSENNLEYVNVAGANIAIPYHNALEKLSFTNFKMMKYFNFQNTNSFFPPGIVIDMPLLNELHIGGNNLSHTLSKKYFLNKNYLKLVNVSSAMLYDAEYDVFTENPNLEVLDISHNKFHTINFLLSNTSIHTLNASDNIITVINDKMVKVLANIRLLYLDLRNNHLNCDCGMMKLIQWYVEQRHDFLELNEHLCYTSSGTVKLEAFDIDKMRLQCEEWRYLTLLISTITLANIVTIIIIIAIIKRKMIPHILFLLHEKISKLRDPEISTYEFDAFVIFSTKLPDRLWVHKTLVNVLEEKYGLKLCIHTRDFIGGRDIADNIEEALEKSRKVIAVVSRNFVESFWCTEEFQLARYSNNQKMIVILYEDLAGVSLPSCIKFSLALRTYIPWKSKKQSVFWTALRKALYKK